MLIIPGFVQDEKALAPLQRALQRLGYQAHTWDQGRNLGFSKDAPIGLVAGDFALAPWLGLLGFVGAIVGLYGWMLRRSGAAR